MAHGDPEALALKNAKEDIQWWLDTTRDFGDPIAEPKGCRLMILDDQEPAGVGWRIEVPESDGVCLHVRLVIQAVLPGRS